MRLIASKAGRRERAQVTGVSDETNDGGKRKQVGTRNHVRVEINQIKFSAKMCFK